MITVPLTPTNLSTHLEFDLFDFNATLQWDPSLPARSVVDHYTVVITHLGHPSQMLQVDSPILNVTLQYNVENVISIVANNCAGTSSVYVSSIEYSKYK